MNAPKPSFDVTAVGRAASELRVPVSQLLEIADRLGVAVAGRINGVVYFSVADVERIAQHVRTTQDPAGIVPREPMY
jgi:hypothetical protein